MFHIDVTIEDSRIIATESYGVAKHPDNSLVMDVVFHDSQSGKSYMKLMDYDQLVKVIAYALSGEDGKPIVVTYDEANQLLKDVPLECRPIP